MRIAPDRVKALESMADHVVMVSTLTGLWNCPRFPVPTKAEAAAWATHHGVVDPATVAKDKVAKPAHIRLALNNGVAPFAEFSLSTIAEAAESNLVGDWAAKLVEHARDTVTVQRHRRNAGKAVTFTAAALVGGEFKAPVAEVLLLPVVTMASKAATVKLVERWEAEDWREARSGDAGSERPHVRPALSLAPAAQLDWLASGRIPTAAVTLLVGDEGIGKSLFWVWLIAYITTGKACLEYGVPAREPAHVFVVATEDDWATAVLPRLEVAGVDLNYVHVVSVDEDGSGAPTFPRDIDVLESAGVTPALVVVDAWLDTVPAGLSVRDPQQARQALHPWREYAARTRAAVLLLTHTNRVATANPRDKYGITSELRKKARSTLFAQVDPDNADCVLIGPEKSNIAGQSAADRFRISAVQHFEPTDSSDGMVPQLDWVESAGRSARELITDAFNGPVEDEDDDTAEGTNWLTDYLMQNGRTPSRIVKAAAREAGIGERRLQRAAERMKRAGDLVYASEGFPRVTAWELLGGLGVDAEGNPPGRCQQ